MNIPTAYNLPTQIPAPRTRFWRLHYNIARPKYRPAGGDFGFRIIDVSRAQIDYSSPLYPRYCSGQPLSTQQGPRRAFVRI